MLLILVDIRKVPDETIRHFAVCQRTPVFKLRKLEFSVECSEPKPKPEKRRPFPQPICKLFQIHGSKLKLDPVRNTSQTSMVCITHSVFFLCIAKHALYAFFSQLIDLLTAFCFAELLNNLPLFICTAFFFDWSVYTSAGDTSISSFSVFAGCCMAKDLISWANKLVIFDVITVVPGLEAIFLPIVSRIWQNRHFSIV